MACVFCDIAQGAQPAHWVARAESVCAFLDVRPVFEGHVLVIPRRHVADFTALTPPELAAVFGLGQRLAAAFPRALGAEGAFVALNHVVSQSVAHVHLHVVPRRKGDGLRGFFWPRRRYETQEAAERIAAMLRSALEGEPAER